MGIAYGTDDNTVWVPGATPNWNSTFGPSGNMQRMVGSLIVADGISMTLHSDAAYTSDQQEQVHAKAEVGFWPFFSASGSGGYESHVTFSDDGQMDISASSPKGQPGGDRGERAAGLGRLRLTATPGRVLRDPAGSAGARGR